MSTDTLPPRTTYRRRFGLDGEEGNSEAAWALLSLLRQIDVASLTSDQMERLDDRAAALMGLVSADVLGRGQRHLQPEWTLTEVGPDTELVPPDHAYRLVHEEDERVISVSAPYPQPAARLADLAKLGTQGRQVEV